MGSQPNHHVMGRVTGPTRFPSLFLEEPEDHGALRREEVYMRFESDDEERLLYAWASVLKSYTGNEELIFLTDAGIVKITTNPWTLEKLESNPSNTKSYQSRLTGIFFQPQAQQEVSLAILCDVKAQKIKIQCNGIVPLDHLQQISEHLRLALQWIQQHGSQDIPISHLKSLGSAILNSRPQVLLGPELLHDLVDHDGADCAIEYQDADGVRMVVSYHELQNRSDQLAARIQASLQHASFSSQPSIAILLPQSVDLYIAQLAIMKSGCAFCPINSDAPDERLQFIVADISAPLVLTTQASSDRLKSLGCPCLIVDKHENNSASKSHEPVYQITTESTAYIMYTSGSTGKPKGVPISHRAATQSLLAHDRHIPKFYRFLQFAAPTFDVSLFEIFFTFYRQATLICCDRRTLLNDLPGFMNALDVDAAELTPTVASSLLQRRSAVPKLKLLLTIGEMLTKPVIEEFGGSDVQEPILWAMYGPTEAAIHCTLQPAFKSSYRVGNIGFPLDSVLSCVVAPASSELYDELVVLPVGFVGELAVGGPQLADKYINRPDQTSAAFIDDPKLGRLYRTGDKARILPNGSIECLGRISTGQVKLRGQRVELGEIEQTALLAPGCKVAAASIISNNLVLFCCAEKDVSEEDITAACQKWLPSFMIPGDVVLLPNFPHLSSGKVDKTALETQYRQHTGQSGSSDENVDENSRKIHRIVQECIGREFDVHSSLIGAGIDSLLTIVVASKLRDAGIEVFPVELMKCRYVRDIAKMVQSDIRPTLTQEKPSPSLERLEEWPEYQKHLRTTWTDAESVRKCSPIQLGMLIESLKNPDAYWNWFTIKFPSTLSNPEIQSIIEDLVQKNEILRSGFTETPVDGFPFVQLVRQATSVPILFDEGNDTTLSLDLPVQFWVQRRQGSTRVHLTIHHACFDGWSMDLILKDLQDLCSGLPLAPRVPYGVVQEYYHTADKGPSLDYWQRHLSQCSPTLISSSSPTKSSEPGVATTSFSLPLDKLRSYTARMGVTPQCVFQAAFICLIAAKVEQAEVILGAVTSGRTLPISGLESVVGPCMTTLPLRININHAREVIDLLARLHLLNRRLVENSLASMSDLKKAAEIPLGKPITEALFIWQESLVSNDIEESDVAIVESSNDHLEFKLTLEIEPQESELAGKLVYDTSVFDQNSASWFLQHVDKLAALFVKTPNTMVLDLPPELVSDDWASIMSRDGNINMDSTVIEHTALEDIEYQSTLEEDQIWRLIQQITKTPISKFNSAAPMSRYGIDSIQAISLAKSLRDLGYENASIALILENPTIRKLAKALQSSVDGLQDSKPAFVDPFLSDDHKQQVLSFFSENDLRVVKMLPCTPLQEAMLSATDSSSDAYCNVMQFHLTGSVERFKAAWTVVLQRHEIFRTAFVQSSNLDYPFVQVVLDGWSDHWADGDENTNSEVMNSELGRNLPILVLRNLEHHLPPVYLRFAKIGSHDHLQFACHHAVYDATAIQQVINEVEMVYRGTPLPKAIPVEPFLNRIQAQRSQKNLQYWAKKLDSFSPTLFRAETRKPYKSTTANIIDLSLFNRKSYDISASLLSASQATLANVVGSVFGKDDICFGTIVSGRIYPLDGLERLVFPTFNTIPVRVDISEYSEALSLIQDLQNLSIESQEYQLTPLRAIQSHLGFSQAGLFNILLLVQHESYILDETVWTLQSDVGNMAYPLVFEVVPQASSNSLSLNLHYDSQIISPHCATEMCQSFVSIFNNFLRFPSSSMMNAKKDTPLRYPALASILYSKPSTNSTNTQDTPFISLSTAETSLFSILQAFTGVSYSNIRPSTSIYHLGVDSIGAIQLAVEISKATGRRVASSDILERPVLRDLAKLMDEGLDNQPEPSPLPFNLAEYEEASKANVTKTLALSPLQFDKRIESIRPCTPAQSGLLAQFIRTGNRYFNCMTFEIPHGTTVSYVVTAFTQLVARHAILRTGFVPNQSKISEFSMVIYQQIDHFPENHTALLLTREQILQWRKDTIARCHQDITRPPWRYMITKSKQRLHLHMGLLHALFDAQCLQMLLRDLAELFTKKNLPLPAPDSSDLIISSIIAGSLAEDTLSKSSSHATFWGEHLGEGSIGEAGPTRFPDLSPLRYPSNTKMEEITSVKTMDQLNGSLRAAGISLQAAAQATWAHILSAYTNEPVVMFGVVLSGRDVIPEAENAVFPCLTTVPFSCRVTNDNEQLLKSIMNFNSGIRRHQFCQSKDISYWAGLPNEPLFDTIVVIQQLPLDIESVSWKLVEEVATDEYTVSIELEPRRSGELLIRATFDEAKLPVKQAKIMLRQFDQLFYQLLDQNDSREVNFHQSLISVLPPKVKALSSPVSLLHQFVERQAELNPRNIALEFITSIHGPDIESQTWTYAQLDFEGNRIASHVQKTVTGKSAMVAICFEKCPEASFSILGILKAGYGYVAIDPNAPDERKKHIIRDSGATIVLTTKSMEHKFDFLDLNSVKVILADSLPAHNIDPKPKAVFISPNDLCYCLYTSGSTGLPKGCELTHQNAVQAMRAFSIQFAGRWNKRSKWLQFASFHFDVSVMEQFWSWSEGIRVVSAPRDLILEDIEGFIKKVEITHLDLTPSLAATLTSPDEIPSLCGGVFITGGEALRQDILDIWGAKSAIFNGYGPTELTIGCTMFRRVPENGKPSNIGHQFDNVGCFVLKPGTDIPVIRGGVGELCCSGKLVGKGYLNNERLTDVKFPFLGRFGERVYRTGDLVRLFHDGTYEFLGRKDDQIKLRGQRLEIGEIDNVIKSFSRVHDVATFVLRHPKQQRQQLVSFVIATVKTTWKHPQSLAFDEQGRAVVSDILEACRSKLPPYMVPTHILPVSTIPLTPNNKVDKKKLTALFELTSLEQIQSFGVDIRTRLNSEESRIASVLSENFSIPIVNITPSSNILELGLDSISAIRLSRLLKQSGYDLASPSLMLQHPVVSSLSQALRSHDQSSADRNNSLREKHRATVFHHKYVSTTSRALGIKISDLKVVTPCTALQEGIVSETLRGKTDHYFVTFKMKLAENIDKTRLRTAWNDAYQNLDILRTCFLQSEVLIQAILKSKALPWQEICISDYSELKDAIAKSRSQWIESSILQHTMHEPLSLVLLEGSDCLYLVLHIYHAIYDGIALGLLLTLVRKLYDGKPQISYGPRYHDLFHQGAFTLLPDSDRFWKEVLNGPVPVSLERLSEPPTNDEPVCRSKVFGNLQGLDTLRRQLGITYQAIVQAVWSVVLTEHHKYHPVIGMVVSGRTGNIEEASEVIGPMFNTILFRPRMQRTNTWESFLKTCHEFNVSALPYQQTPLRDVLKSIRSNPSTTLNNLFTFQARDEEVENYDNNSFWTLEDENPGALYPLNFEAELRDETLAVCITGQSQYFTTGTIEGLLDRFEIALSLLISDATRPINEKLDIPSGDTKEIPQTKRATEDQAPLLESFEWTEVARRLRSEIAAVALVQVDSISSTQTIFELGLDSIDVIKLSANLLKHGINAPVSMIMQYATLKALTEQLHAILPSNGISKKPSLTQVSGNLEKYLIASGVLEASSSYKCFPATPLQEGMYSTMINSNFTQYYNHDILKINPGIDLDKLKTAWQSTIDNNDILRTVFLAILDPGIDSTYAQVVLPAFSIAWRELSLSHDEDVSKVLDEIKHRAEDTTTFDSLLRLTTVTQCQQNLLVLSLPHTLYDGWSILLLHEYIKALYYDQEVEVIPYDSVLEHINQQSESEAASFWSSYLLDSPSWFLSALGAQQSRVHRQEVISAISVPVLRTFCKKQGITMHTLTQTCWTLVLASKAEVLEVIYGVVLSCRDSEEAQRVMFPTMNTIAFRSFIVGTFAEILREVQNDLISIRQHQQYPLRKAQKLADLSGKTLFDTLFLFQARPDAGSSEFDDLYTSVDSHSSVEYAVCVEAEITTDGLVWRTACQEGVLAEDEMSIISCLEIVLQAMVKSPENDCLQFRGDGNKVSVAALPEFELNDSILQDMSSDTPVAGLKQENSPLANVVREALAAVAGVDKQEISSASSIFSLGLDSISAIKVCAQLKKSNINLRLSDLLRNPTVLGIVEAIKSTTADNGPIAAQQENLLSDDIKKAALSHSSLSEDDIEAIYQASAGQAYFLEIWKASKGALFYPEFQYQVQGSVDMDRIEQAWATLANLEPILRTSFVSSGRGYLQIIRKPQGTTKHPRDSKLSKSSNWPCLHQVNIHETENKKFTLHLKIHHALYDLYSLATLMTRFEDILNASTIPPPFNLNAHSAAINSTQSPNIGSAKTFWTAYLSNHPPIPAKLQPPFNGQTIEIFKPNHIPDISPLQTLARKHSISLQALLLALYAHHHQQTTTQPGEAVVLGIYMANRPDTPSTVPTLNILPLKITPSNSIVDTARQIQGDLAQIRELANSTVSMWQIYEWTGICIETTVNFLGAEEGEGEERPVTVRAEMDEVLAARAKIVERDVSGFTEPDELKNDGNDGVYQPGIDIEFAVRDGGLDVGLFCPQQTMDLKEAEKHFVFDIGVGALELD
ncbi:hypothetical protein BT63DRAFT_172487 [Microthyrium microscopicum]|uniref:Carrier domain-containing protein n=1 Tax=Microthyrium microscopicum TaxID=703497 RepID=A0A6A6UP09_9PEZI|nr:hypothetical protein BT63DRAFT_172487 [Microthyrium microscopicum]